MEDLLRSLGASAAVVGVYMAAWFAMAMVRGRNDIVDIAWGLGFVTVAWAAVVRADVVGTRLWVVAALVTIWGLRLAVHVGLRQRGKPEDFRYRKWREDWGQWFVPRTILQVFGLQGLLMLFVGMPIIVVGASSQDGIGLLEVVGTALWAIGFFFETVGDLQLARFKSDTANKGRVMTTGLWSLTRHPNYFGEVALWWGIGLVALSSEMGWLGLIGPATITFLLLKVSGIPMLEKRYEGDPEFEEYKAVTSAFFPLPPRNASPRPPTTKTL
jgi:steroid 5-alpha reductase family enzyme